MNFHWYGFIIGLAILLVWFLMDKRALQEKIDQDILQKIFTIALVSGLFGARIWHVLTDFYLYQDSLVGVFKIWQGGLSILGAILAGVLAVYIFCLRERRIKFLQVLDLIALSLPFAQALGRFGNFINQELYGLPSNLPWSIFIEEKNRVTGYENIARYHPVFAYETILMIVLGLFFWLIIKDKWKVGSGKFALFYFYYYVVARFCLDFIRLERPVVFNSGLGINQILLLGFIIIITSILLIKKKLK